MDEKQLFKAAFLQCCAADGMDAQETAEFIKSSGVLDNITGVARDAAGTVGRAGAGLAALGLVTAPIAAGIGSGYLAAKATEVGTDTPEEVKLQELIAEHRRLAQEARLNAAIAAYKKQVRRSGRPLL